MLSKTSIDRTTGALLLALTGALFGVLATSSFAGESAEGFHKSLQQIVDQQGLHLAYVALLHILSVLVIAVAAGIYLAFRPHCQALALLGAFGFLALGATFMLSNIAGGALVNIAEQFGASSGVQADIVERSARALAMMKTFALIDELTTFLSLSLLAFGGLIAWRKAVPRWMG